MDSKTLANLKHEVAEAERCGGVTRQTSNAFWEARHDIISALESQAPTDILERLSNPWKTGDATEKLEQSVGDLLFDAKAEIERLNNAMMLAQGFFTGYQLKPAREALRRGLSGEPVSEADCLNPVERPSNGLNVADFETTGDAINKHPSRFG